MLHVEMNVSPNQIGNVNAAKQMALSVKSITVSDSLNFNKPPCVYLRLPKCWPGRQTIKWLM